MGNLDLSSLSTAIVCISLFAPGVIITFLRSQFISGRRQRAVDATIELAVISSLYYSVFGLAFLQMGWTKSIHLLALLFFIPAVLGIILGLLAQYSALRGLLTTMGINPIHSAETGWDFMFRTLKNPVWMIVSLKDGSKIHGWFNEHSAASTALDRRDLFLAEVRDKHFNEPETDGRRRGMWIREDLILSIEIIPDERDTHV